MFCAGHPDIFPVGDLAVRRAAQRVLELEVEPAPAMLETLALVWSPDRLRCGAAHVGLLPHGAARCAHQDRRSGGRTALTLSGPRRPPRSGNRPSAIVIFVHGYGADGSDLIALADTFAPVLPDALFLSPDAPGKMPHGGREWFPLTMRDPSEYKRGVEAAAPQLDRYIDDELAKASLDESRLALVGFSQGTMMSLQVAYRRPRPVAAVVGFSGVCAGAEPGTLEAGPHAPRPRHPRRGAAGRHDAAGVADPRRGGRTGGVAPAARPRPRDRPGRTRHGRQSPENSLVRRCRRCDY